MRGRVRSFEVAAECVLERRALYLANILDNAGGGG
jgi:hypothetical protein